jgi:muramoyltetrapeptide carboxypeptidase
MLEDVAEQPYRLERALAQLIDSGGRAGAGGVALGAFVGWNPADDAGDRLAEGRLEHLEPLGIPVVHHLPVGHGSRNHAFRYGGNVVLGPDGITPE